ncbi:zinc finger MYM-type protein 1-like [Epinephelus lanceolatus]
MEAWTEFKMKQDSGSKISHLLDVGHSKLVKENQQYMKAMVESLCYTACQGIAQRGHAEVEQSTNRGNFIELLNVISMFDSTVAKKISDNPSNAKYTHHDIQNEIFSVMANMLRKEISDEVKEAECFALMVDESKDVSKKEQISIVVHYLKKGDVHEEFLHFDAADGLDADFLLNSIKSTLSQCNIDVKACIEQCYDGAAVMSGCHSGVQQRLCQEVPQALYIHCHAHRVNLVLVDCVNNVKTAAEFFKTVQMLYNFFSGSAVHDMFLKKQKELEPKVQCIELKRLSDTRWACQYPALCAIKKALPSIQATLQDIISQPNPRRSAEARAISAIIDEQFVLHLTLFEDLFRLTKFMSDQLQSPDLDLASAGDLTQSVISAISEKCTEDSWTDIRERAEELCEKASITVQSPPCDKRQAQPPQHLKGFVVEAPIERRHDTMDDMRQHSFYPIIDRVLSEMKGRFSLEANNVLMGVTALSPKHTAFLNKQKILPMSRYYGIDEKNLTAELHQVCRLLQKKKDKGHTVNSTREFLSLMGPYKDAFEDLYKLICISNTSHVFSKLRTEFLLPPAFKDVHEEQQWLYTQK